MAGRRRGSREQVDGAVVGSVWELSPGLDLAEHIKEFVIFLWYRNFRLMFRDCQWRLKRGSGMGTAGTFLCCSQTTLLFHSDARKFVDCAGVARECH